jgi:hypothetical protein
MLNFIPMNNKASIFKQSSLDNWGKPSLVADKTVKCAITYNTDLAQISGEDGVSTTMSASIVMKGLVDIRNGDYISFTTALGVGDKYRVVDVYFFEDWAGKIIATRVVVGSGKRS